MKCECIKQKLTEMIQKAEKIAGKNPTLPVLSCVLLECKDRELIISSTNLNLGLEIRIPAKVEKNGKTAVNSSFLNSVLNNLSNEGSISLELEGNVMFLNNKNSKINLKTQSYEDFPDIPKLKENQESFISSSILLDGIKSVWYSSSNSSIKPELSSVYLYQNGDEIVFVATDSFRLAEKKIKNKNSENLIASLIPFKNAVEIIRVFEGVNEELKISTEKNQISIKNKEIYLVSRIIEGNFPDYKNIIPKETLTKVGVLKNDFVSALKVSQIFSDNLNQVYINVNSRDKNMEIVSKNPEKGENSTEIRCSVDGESTNLSFNQKYLTDCLGSINSDTLILGFNGQTKALVITGAKNDGFMYLVMPMNR